MQRLLFLLLASCLNASATLQGTVTSSDGRPLAGVVVYGSLSKTCCPFKRESTITDESGQFRLENPGDVVHFVKEGLQPRLVVLKGRGSELNVTLDALRSYATAPNCESSRPDDKRIGWGKYGLQFDVPNANAEIRGGKPDVDYVRYVIKRKGGKGFLELWFGGHAMDVDPEDDLVVNSVSVQQRPIISSEGQLVGLDSSGRLQDGTAWRQIFVSGKGARYSKASDEDATFFNQVIDSFCLIPYPAH